MTFKLLVTRGEEFVFYKYNSSHEWLTVFSIQVGGFRGGSVVDNPATDAEDTGLIPQLGRSPGKGNDSLSQYPCLGNPTDRGSWQATVHGLTRVRHSLATKQQQQICKLRLPFRRRRMNSGHFLWHPNYFQLKRHPQFSSTPSPLRTQHTDWQGGVAVWGWKRPRKHPLSHWLLGALGAISGWLHRDSQLIRY